MDKLKELLSRVRTRVEKREYWRGYSGTMGMWCEEFLPQVLEADLDAIEAEIHALLEKRRGMK